MRPLLITLGGADYPAAPSLRHDAFAASNREVVRLLTDPEAPLVDREDTLALFNDDRFWPGQLILLRDWIRERCVTGDDNKNAVTDIVVHYVGHGSFKPNSLDYYLTINSTDNEEQAETSISLVGLHNVLRRYAQKLRILIIIDACFAAAALRHLQHGSADAQVRAQVTQIIGKADRMSGGSAPGIAVLCASEKYETANAAGRDGLTQFTEAFSAVLKSGVVDGPERLSIGDILKLMISLLKTRYEQPVLPVLLAPEGGRGSLGRFPIFPNRGWQEDVRHAIPLKEEDILDLKEKADAFLSELEGSDDPLIVEKKISQIAHLGLDEVRKADAKRVEIIRGPPLVPMAGAATLEAFERYIAGLSSRRDARPGTWLSFLIFSGLVTRRPVFDQLVAALSTERVAGFLAGILSLKDDCLISNATIDVFRVGIYQSRIRLAQTRLLSTSLASGFAEIQERCESTRPKLARQIAVSVRPTLQERLDNLMLATRKAEACEDQLIAAKSANIELVRGIDRLASITTEELQVVRQKAVLLAQLRSEKKNSPDLVRSCYQSLDGILAEVRNVCAIYERARLNIMADQ